MDEEELLKRMTRLLEQGCTMLANHHSCGAPLFRCKGEIICPACSLEEGKVLAAAEEPVSEMPLIQEEMGRRAVQAGDVEPIAPAESVEPIPSVPQKGGAGTSSRDELGQALSLLRRALLHRLRDLTEGVLAEDDLDKLHRLLSCIERIVNILHALER
ncbi:MAG: Sjogren's syndrome/scleroderma autoantigen 1 family protein [Methanotrichaceae archaeon]|nr:Sjogren's syndrome/scleroderma autoantigen 1 family protein [Methanotrichaceae archaeon]